MRFQLILIGLLISQITCLNIIISTTDSWVSKNVRFLYQSLKEEGHNVLMIAPLYQHKRLEESKDLAEGDEMVKSSDSIDDGGDFGHLLKVHQEYFQKIRNVNRANRKVKSVLSKKEIEELRESKEVVSNNYFGQDKLDESVWYVNSSPLNTLLVGLDIILPDYYPEFVPDLLIIGPNEGLSTSEVNADELTSMLEVSMVRDILTFGVSEEDSHHVYFQNEKYFDIQLESTTEMLRRNIFGKNIRFVNRRISSLIDNWDFSQKTPATSVNINFPSINYQSSVCFTSSNEKYNPNYQNIVLTAKPSTHKNTKYPKYVWKNDRVVVNYFMEASFNHIDGQELKDQSLLSNFNDVYDIPTFNTRLSTKRETFLEITDNYDLNKLMNNDVEREMVKYCQISFNVHSFE